ncbi:hypothetical protein C8R28_10117 [Nitrosomonas ureae]|uniref:Uncharacterized protein n=1 Tax=Nitrosomonas ureae TaxID=44577 RepID=A0A2T5IQL9_9PROT|nr:hypothetical protein C8R28_10117 [Nitrosomonas ureae]
MFICQCVNYKDFSYCGVIISFYSAIDNKHTLQLFVRMTIKDILKVLHYLREGIDRKAEWLYIQSSEHGMKLNEPLR